MSESLEKFVKANCEIPPMPAVAAKIIDLLSDDDVTAARLTEVISRDLALATRVLNMANSSFYRRLEEIRELGTAIVILGMRTIRSLVLSASLKQLFKPSSLFDNMLWEHSVAAAVTGLMLAKEIRYPYPDEVMVASLLHDIGKKILNNSMPERYQQVVERVYQEGLAYCEVEREAFGFGHHQVGPLLVKHWNLPINLGKAIYYHHEINGMDNMFEEQKKLVALVCLANLFCRKLGLGYRQADESVDVVRSPAAAILDLQMDEGTASSFEESVIQTFEQEKGSFA